MYPVVGRTKRKEGGWRGGNRIMSCTIEYAEWMMTLCRGRCRLYTPVRLGELLYLWLVSCLI